jgi:hypothetical protein
LRASTQGSLPGDEASAVLSMIMALETVAALHRLAGVPLVVLVDQLEVLVRTPDASAFESMGSLLKKFIEQLSQQSAMVFLAGVPEAWDKLMRDVAARFRQRSQIVIGGLALPETRLLLNAYLNERTGLSPFTESAVDTIYALSGGIPREVLRIAHGALDATGGDPASATERTILESARASGSIDDRARVALASVDAVIASVGYVGREALVDGQKVDRVVSAPTGEVVLAVLIVRATDPLNEIDSVRRVQSARNYCREHWPAAEVLTVMVGYSSAEVDAILRRSGSNITFAEKTFEPELQTMLLSIAQERSVRPATVASEVPAPAKPDPALLLSLNEISARLSELEQSRSAESLRVRETFAAEAAVLSAPVIAERDISTRREVLDALDSLRELIERGDISRERQVMRSILVANEAYLNNPQLEDLGEVYLESVTLANLEGGHQTRFERLELLSDMSDALRRPNGIQTLLAHSRQMLVAMVGSVLGFVVSGVLSSTYRNPVIGADGKREQLLFLPMPEDFITILPFVFLALLIGLCYFYLIAMLSERWRRARNRTRRDTLREMARQRGSNPAGLKQKYPQSDM